MILLSMFSKLVPSSSQQQCFSVYIGMPRFIAFLFFVLHRCCFFFQVEGKTLHHKMTATYFIVILKLDLQYSLRRGSFQGAGHDNSI